MPESANAAEEASELLNHTANTWTLGADPEFAVYSALGNRIFNAAPYSVQFHSNAGSVGLDHGGRVWELRPAPSRSAYKVVENLGKLCSAPGMSKIEEFRWKAGGIAETDTLGGHVHYGFVELSPTQRAALDRLTTGLIALEILPSAESAARITHYAGYGGVTRNSNGHVEYRAPASWLDKPGQALAVLVAFKLAALSPDEIGWPLRKYKLTGFKNWLSRWSNKDADAWLLERLIEKQGFRAIRADPNSNFRLRWRKERLWS